MPKKADFIYSKQLEPLSIKSVQLVNEDANEICNDAENSNAQSMGFKFPYHYLLIFIQFFVCLAWMNQLAFHQTWLSFAGSLVSWKTGFLLSILVSLIPLVPSLFLLKKQISSLTCHIDYQDIKIILILLGLSIFIWWFFSEGAIDFPVHTYGDETFHTHRIEIMAKDFQSWIEYFFKSHTQQPPPFLAEYMFYPALAYIPITALTGIFGDVSSIADQRFCLIIYYLTVIFSTYLLARLFIQSRLISSLITLLPITSPLLLTYTTSFYIELPYVSIFIFSFWLLAWGIKNLSKEIVLTAVLVSSLAPIIRESALAGTAGIIFSAMLWEYMTWRNKNFSGRKKILQHLSIIKYFVLGLLPFIAYYLAKSNYTNWDKNRTSFAFLFQQDYFSLLSYSLLYLGPLAIISFLVFFISSLQRKKEGYLILAAIIGIIGAVLSESIFLPGYMPWSRNYLFFYAQFILLIILFFAHLSRVWAQEKITLLIFLSIGVVFNFAISVFYLQDSDLFHESEIVFNLKPVSSYIEQHPQAFIDNPVYIGWPAGFPTYPEKLLPSFITLKKIDSVPIQYHFPEFSLIRKALPTDANYLLFYYLKNDSKPTAFHNIPSVSLSKSLELEGFKILAESVDPWSNGKNGVLLLKKIQ